MDIKQTVDSKDYNVGVIIARFQVHELHEAHKEMIDLVVNNHKKTLIFLGISNIPNTKNNPLDFATRQSMIQDYVPNALIVPIKDSRSDEVWSKELDRQISLVFGDNIKPLLYGSRDSFIPHYKGRYTTVELTSDTFVSGTEIRNNVSEEILKTQDFRAGVIHANYAQRATVYPTVDIVCYNDKGQILLAKKPNEEKYRFVGGFVDPKADNSYEHAARREFLEETGGNGEISPLQYVTSQFIDDWRYQKEESGIMTTLFIGFFRWGYVRPSDDISELKWFDFSKFLEMEQITYLIMEEHRDLMVSFVNKIKDGTLNISTLENQNKEKV
tara:strand:+ start:185757 stop:186740 length:984 start_codon:yes stop_codon:yes gene_type:complete